MSFFCTLPVVGLLFSSCLPPAPLATGYVEGDYTLIAPIEMAQITEISVKRGDRVIKDQILAQLESEDVKLAVQKAEAALAQANSSLANLKQGARPEKIASLKATLNAARLSAEQAERDLDRQRRLLEKGSLAQSVVDTSQTAYQVAAAKVEEIKANLEYAQLPARENEIAAADGAIRQAQAALLSARWRLEQRTLKAPGAGVVNDIVHETGEMAGPSAAVLSILPKDGIKLRLYVPQNALATIKIGSELSVECDSCGANLSARVNYISDGPEFTPPVIYSLENRQKLVYQIEAKPALGSDLKPGQIVSVRLASPTNGSTQ